MLKAGCGGGGGVGGSFGERDTGTRFFFYIYILERHETDTGDFLCGRTIYLSMRLSGGLCGNVSRPAAAAKNGLPPHDKLTGYL